MKQLLIILLFISTLTKAQDTIKIPTPVAKQIAKELVGCDSVKAVHELTKEQLKLTEQKVVLKDSIISGYVQKDTMYEQRIINEQLKFDIQGKFVKDLQKQNRRLKVKMIFTNIILGTTAGGLLGGITYILLTK
jgi:hypothetical protein